MLRFWCGKSEEFTLSLGSDAKEQKWNLVVFNIPLSQLQDFILIKDEITQKYITHMLQSFKPFFPSFSCRYRVKGPV
jgi:hypothetical protein